MVIERREYGEDIKETVLSSARRNSNSDLLKNLSENYDEMLLDAMGQDIQQLVKDELQSLLKMFENLNASRRRDPIVEYVSFRDWMLEYSELFPQTSQLLEEVNKNPSPKLVKELTNIVEDQLENYFGEDEDFE